MKKVLLTATVQSHIAQFHKPLIKILKENGYEVHVAAHNNLAEKNGLSLNEPDKTFDVPFERNPFNKMNIQAFNQLSEIMEENSYDIVHCNTPVGGVLTRLAARKFRKNGLKVFYTAHGFHFYKGAPIINWLLFYPIEKILATITDTLITITKEDYKVAKAKFNTDVRHIHGVGVDPERFFPITDTNKNKTRTLLGYKQSDYIILSIGELNKNKNQETIIRAISEIVRKKSNVKLLIAGNGPLNNNLNILCRKLKLENHVEFLGYVTDIDIFIGISDLLVSASQREGLPLNIIEAMLSHKNVLASYNRGHEELINPGVNGVLVEYNDFKGYSSEIIRYIENPMKAREIANNGYYSVKEYTTNSVINELKYIYSL